MQIPVTHRITPEEYEKLNRVAKEEKTSLQNVIRGIVKVALATEIPDLPKEQDATQDNEPVSG